MTAAPAVTGQPPRRGGDGGRGFRGTVRGRGGRAAASVLVCLAVAALAVVLVPRPSTDMAVPVSYQRDLAALHRIASFPVISPQPAPAGWQPVSSRLTGHHGGVISWHLGFVTPADRLASLEESDERPAEFIRRMTNSGNQFPPLSYRGMEWARRWRPDKDQRSLYHSTPGGPTIVVTGNASWQELEALAGSLRPQPR